MATSLAKFGPAHIIIASRTANKAEPVLKEIKSIDSSVKTTFVQVDLSDHDSVRQAAKEILATAPKINVLTNSAGNMALKKFTVDKQGAAETGNARVVNLTSSGYLISPVRVEDWNYYNGKEYDGLNGSILSSR